MAQAPDEEEEVGYSHTANLFVKLPGRHSNPVMVSDYVESHPKRHIFLGRPFTGVLLFDNKDSDCRDNLAAERTFLSYLRLSVYMAVVSIAIVVSFHIKDQPSAFELQIAKPVGIVFWCLSVICLAAGFGNYVKTVKGYSRRQAVVQSGWKTQTIISIITLSIVAVCVLFLATDSKRH